MARSYLHIHGVYHGVFCLLACACGPTPGTGSAGSTAGSTAGPDTTAGPGTTTGIPEPTTSVGTEPGTTADSSEATSEPSGEPTDTGDPSDTGDTAATTEQGSDSDTEGTCPEPMALDLDFELMPSPAKVDEECLVAAIDHDVDAFTLTLSCVQQSFTLWVASSELQPPGLAGIGEEVHLSYVQAEGEIGIEQWLAIRHDRHAGIDKTVLGLVSAARLDPPQTTLNEFFVSPEVAISDGLCAPEDTPCGQTERVGLRFSEAFGEAVVLDQQVGYYGVDFVSQSLAVVEAALVHPFNNCDEPSMTRFAFGIGFVFTGP